MRTLTIPFFLKAFELRKWKTLQKCKGLLLSIVVTTLRRAMSKNNCKRVNKEKRD